MRTLLAILCTLLALASAGTAAPESAQRPEPSAWRFAHPDAQILAGADLFRLGQSPAGEQLRQRFLAAMGPELSRHVQRLLVSTIYLADGAADSVLILSGPLNAARIKQMATAGQAKLNLYQGIEMIVPPSGSASETHFAIIDAQTALLGSRRALTAAIDRGRRPRRPLSEANPLFGRALAFGPEADVWVLTAELPVGFGPASWDARAGMELVLTVKPEATLTIGIELPESARLDAALQALDQDRSRRPLPSYSLAAWLPRLTALHRTSGLALAGTLSESTLIGEFPALGAVLGLPVKPLAAAPNRDIAEVLPQPPPPPAPAPPLRIRIEGLENGPLEIPYPPGK
jgi:hypothetical protein